MDNILLFDIKHSYKNLLAFKDIFLTITFAQLVVTKIYLDILQ